MKRRCIYCFEASSTKLTEDHVPPKSFYLPEERGNFRPIKVPSCEKCNNEVFKEDESRFRVYLAVRSVDEGIFSGPILKEMSSDKRKIRDLDAHKILVNGKEKIALKFHPEAVARMSGRLARASHWKEKLGYSVCEEVEIFLNQSAANEFIETFKRDCISVNVGQYKYNYNLASGIWVLSWREFVIAKVKSTLEKIEASGQGKYQDFYELQ